MNGSSPVLHLIEKARQAQQQHEQKHAVQLEIPYWRDYTMIDEDMTKAWDWLEDSIWKHLTNVADYYVDYYVDDEYYPPQTGDEIIDSIMQKYGEENVRVDDVAYDCDKQVIDGFRSVFVKRHILVEG